MNRETAKLKTEVVDGKIKGCTIQSLNHDALYAHALVQAIEEYRAPWVLTQADAIMAYWQEGAK